jgi:glutamate synthase (NADPH/NADH) small chain
MPEQDPRERAKNFNEVAKGYSEADALAEADRCLNCKIPLCKTGCPVGVPIPEFIGLIKEGKHDEASKKIKETNALPAVCGRVCPQEKQCESACVLGKRGEPVAIGRLERFAADHERDHNNIFSPLEGEGAKTSIDSSPLEGEGAKTSIDSSPLEGEGAKTSIDSSPLEGEGKGEGAKRVAVVGSGPGGLTCASYLARMGYGVTMFEALHEAGGVLVYGIPEFRLPKDIVKNEIEYIKTLGVEVRTDAVIGNLFTIDDLMVDMDYDAVFIASGAGFPMFMNIPGENLNGVYSANEFLTRANLMKAYKFPEYDTPLAIGRTVAVVGGGNVAIDSARVALRLGAEKVYLVYRRSLEELPARAEEVEHAREEGVEFHLLNNPVEVVGNENGSVKGLRCIRMELGEPDDSGRRKPVEIKGSEFELAVETIIMSIGTRANPLIGNSAPNLELTKRGYIAADEETGETSMPGVFAGGDIVTGSATVIAAMGAGKRAAAAIDKYLQSK